MQSRKMVLMNLFAGQQWRCRQRRKICGHWGKERVGRIERVEWKHIYITVCKIDSQWEFAV